MIPEQRAREPQRDSDPLPPIDRQKCINHSLSTFTLNPDQLNTMGEGNFGMNHYQEEQTLPVVRMLGNVLQQRNQRAALTSQEIDDVYKETSDEIYAIGPRLINKAQSRGLHVQNTFASYFPSGQPWMIDYDSSNNSYFLTSSSSSKHLEQGARFRIVLSRFQEVDPIAVNEEIQNYHCAAAVRLLLNATKDNIDSHTKTFDMFNPSFMATLSTDPERQAQEITDAAYFTNYMSNIRTEYKQVVSWQDYDPATLQERVEHLHGCPATNKDAKKKIEMTATLAEKLSHTDLSLPHFLRDPFSFTPTYLDQVKATYKDSLFTKEALDATDPTKFLEKLPAKQHEVVIKLREVESEDLKHYIDTTIGRLKSQFLLTPTPESTKELLTKQFVLPLKKLLEGQGVHPHKDILFFYGLRTIEQALKEKLAETKNIQIPVGEVVPPDIEALQEIQSCSKKYTKDAHSEFDKEADKRKNLAFNEKLMLDFLNRHNIDLSLINTMVAAEYDTEKKLEEQDVNGFTVAFTALHLCLRERIHLTPPIEWLIRKFAPHIKKQTWDIVARAVNSEEGNGT